MVTIGNFISVIVLFKAFINPNNQNKHFNLLLLLGSLWYFFGSIYWAYYQYEHASPPDLGLYDVIMLLAYSFFIWALIYFFKIHKVVLTTTYLFDILIFTVITSTLSWVFIIRPFLIPAFDNHSLLVLITYLGYPILDLTVLFACLMILLYTSLSRAILFIISGFLINIIANSIYFYQSIDTTNLIGYLVDPLWVLSILLIGFSGLDKFEANKTKQRTYFKKYFQLFIPYSIMIIFLFVVYVNFYDIKDPLLIGVFIAILLLMTRLFNSINRNEALNKEINQKNKQLKDANDTLRFLAYHDELTKLPNRHFLFEKMNNNAHQNMNFYLLFIDLDGFKSVNDTFGHHVGDLLLKQVANRLQDQVSESDFLCRFAGDEFIILSTNKDKQSVEKLATALVDTLSESYSIDSQHITISSSIGISSLEETDSMLSMIHRADKAMYHIKKNGKNGFGFL